MYLVAGGKTEAGLSFINVLLNEGFVKIGKNQVTHQDKRKINDSEPGHVVFQGDVITHDPGYLNGHGTYMEQDLLFAGVAGVVEMVNTVISVTPVKTRYNGEFVDVVVGRIVEVQQKQGNINSRLRTRHGAKKNCQCCPV